MPDINSLSQSTPAAAATATATSEQASAPRPSSSQQMPPPPNPSSPSLNILPSNQSAVNNTASGSNLPSPHFQPLASPGLSQQQQQHEGPGPLRHPRPLTAADLHHELEKEQEAVVNRLNRELAILRTAANASVASNTSSTSAASHSHSTHGGADASHPHGQLPEPHPLLSGPSGFTIPSSTGRMHHNRTASNTSIRSASQIATAGSSTPAGPRTNPISIPLSRQNSQQSQTRRSRTSSPAPGSESFGTGLGASGGYFPGSSSHSARYPMAGPGSIPTGAAQQYPGSSELSPGLLPGTRQYEETAYFRSELESVKRENDSLRRRIRELERMVRSRRASDASRTRSESVSTTASASVVGTGAGATTGAGIAGPRGEAATHASAHHREAQPSRDAKEKEEKKKETAPAGAGPSASTTSASATPPAPAIRPDAMSARDRVASSMSVASSVAVGVPEEELRVGESAASRGVAETTPQRSPAPR